MNFNIKLKKIPFAVPLKMQGGKQEDKSHCNYYSRIDSSIGCVAYLFWGNILTPKYHRATTFWIDLSNSKPDFTYQKGKCIHALLIKEVF